MDLWLKIWAALAGAPGVVYVGKWLFNRWAARDADRMENHKRQSEAWEKSQNEQGTQRLELEKKKLDMLPDMMDRYTAQLEALRLEIKTTTAYWEKKLEDTVSRMEREAQRMLNHIILLNRVNNAMRNKLYLADTIMQVHDKEWDSMMKDFPVIETPDFRDPKPEPPKS